ncbi:VCBS repeat-containing protein [Nocardioides agariphilus]|jgi:hypothetical protein|uniref:VCBS repeat-containing protein n=1 Tax=Nocardioides agariphilus TaxID=433664 RepID=A0A930YPX0_9ACTN|nr:FG-GAP-like repeat-containing protein [Nocardioides agariphilus]MBF4768120.1 VCBS repeat-containing protein [Nocardioides agariphilus]
MSPGPTPFQARFVTATQQLLALAVVCAGLTPALGVVSLDVVAQEPGTSAAATAKVLLSAYGEEAQQASRLPSGPVSAKVREVQLTQPASAATTGRTFGRIAPRTANARVAATPGSTRLTSLPQRVTGYGSIGVTWAHGVTVPDTDLSFQVRTRTDGAWSSWTTLDYHDDHGPDPDSAEGRHARPGTEPLLVGNVDDVQVRADTTTILPADMQLAVIAPGKPASTVTARAAIDTSTMDGNHGAHSAYDAAALGAAEQEAGNGDLALAAATYTPKPVIYSRAQWGANENMREKSALHYYEVHAGFVHHTVNANDYTPSEVPGILRSIYAYHTQSRGWSDIGYNFLVDRFGRIWEGRYGGVDRPVVGAHTLNYNENSFAMSAIGNFELVRPSAAMLQAYGVLFAWKLSLHGVDASSTKQWVGSKYFQAINGHRDAAATACPGKYLYAKIPLIREYAAAAQQGWAGRELESSIAGSPYPDLLVRRASDKQVYVVPTGGMTRFSAPIAIGGNWSGSDMTMLVPDVTGDGKADLLARSAADGSTQVRPGNGQGGFGQPAATFTSLAGRDLVAAVGDLNGDGHADLVARDPGSGRLDAYLGNGRAGFTVKRTDGDWSKYDLISGPGDVDGDGHDDLVARGIGGAFYLLPGLGGIRFGDAQQIRGSWRLYDTITGHGDFTGDGRPDLLVRPAGSSQLYVRPNRGHLRFGHPLGPVNGPAGATGISAGASAYGSAAPDLLARSGDSLVLLRNAGTTETGAMIPTGVFLPTAVAMLNAGDWDRDGYADMIVRNAGSGTLWLYRGNGKGGFAAPLQLATGFAGVRLLAAVGDMTGDGYPDLTGQPRNSAMRIYPGNGTSGLKASYVAYGAISATSQVPVGRWDSDGAPDSLFRSGGRLTFYAGNGPGGFTGAKALRTGVTKYDWMVGVADMGVNGHSGVVVRETETGYLWLLTATTRGFSKRIFLAQGFKAYDLAG